MHLETEALLIFAARREHIETVIRPALVRGAWVLCDRFTDSSFAYQCGGRGLPADKLQALREWVHADLEPGATILFDLAARSAQARLTGARDKDRFEAETLSFHQRVRDAYRRLAAAEPERIHVVDGATDVEGVRVVLNLIAMSLVARTHDHLDAAATAMR